MIDESRVNEIEFERRFVTEESVLNVCVREDTDVLYNVDIELCVVPTSVENVENPSLITAVEISFVNILREYI
jgi:hypothetical protein